MPYESQKIKKERASKIISLLNKYYPRVHCELNFSNPLELLVGVILSAQCTDKRVNQVTLSLFKKYKTPKDYIKVPIKEFETDIHSTGFYRNKAKNIKSCMKRIEEVYQGKVPKTMEDLTSLAGVGRKTANVILGTAYGISSGVVVDTHMSRLAYRFNFSLKKSAEKIEQTLNNLIPKKFWIFWSYAIVYHGRYVCKARRPLCEKCFLTEVCPQKGVKKSL